MHGETHCGDGDCKPSATDLNKICERQRAIIDAAVEGIITITSDQRITSFNKAATNIFGYAAADVIGQSLDILLPERLREKHSTYVQQFQKSNVTYYGMDERADLCGRRIDGSEFHAEISIAKISVGDSMELGAFVRDISRHMRLIEELYHRATTDPLTGLHNRRHTVEEAEKEMARAKRFSHPISVILIDIDDFKSINDTYGHAIGDETLEHAAVACKLVARESDIVARWGGEEFLLLLPETSMNGAMRLAKRIQGQMHGLHNGIAELGDRQITASIGVSTWHQNGDNFGDMVYRADQAMYKAKHTGKNKIINAENKA